MKQIEKGSSQADSWDKPSRWKKNNVETNKIGKKIVFFKNCIHHLYFNFS